MNLANTLPDRKEPKLQALLYRWIRLHLGSTLLGSISGDAALQEVMDAFDVQFAAEFGSRPHGDLHLDAAWVLRQWHEWAWERCRVYEARDEYLKEWVGRVEERRALE